MLCKQYSRSIIVKVVVSRRFAVGEMLVKDCDVVVVVVVVAAAVVDPALLDSDHYGTTYDCHFPPSMVLMAADYQVRRSQTKDLPRLFHYDEDPMAVVVADNAMAGAPQSEAVAAVAVVAAAANFVGEAAEVATKVVDRQLMHWHWEPSHSLSFG